MAVVKPFRALRYNSQRLPDLSRVVSQPYDRIDDELQQQYYALSPYNIVRIIQGRDEPGDVAEGPNVYTRARSYLQSWQDEGILTRDTQPALYAYEQLFSVGGTEYRRLGMIAAVQLTEFDEGIILPHERTHGAPKEDRFRLMSALKTNTEQIFMMYPDPTNTVNALLRNAIHDRAPDMDVVELFENGVRQRLWHITDHITLEAIEQEMAPKRNLIIADGHHRYETALAYRRQQLQRYPDAPPNAAFHFVPTMLVSMDDPGLVILPTHREIVNFDALSPQALLDTAQEIFSIDPVPDLAGCLSRVYAHPAGHAFGFYGGPHVRFHVLTLKDEGAPLHLIEKPFSREWKSLPVSILHDILFHQIARIPEQGIEDKSMIRYHRDPQEAVSNINAGHGNFVFFVSATRIKQIKAITAHGEKMPQKSTDFYPKVISGLTMLHVGENEQL